MVEQDGLVPPAMFAEIVAVVSHQDNCRIFPEIEAIHSVLLEP